MKYGNFIDIDTCTIEHTAKNGQTWLIQIQADLLGESFSDSQITKPLKPLIDLSVRGLARC